MSMSDVWKYYDCYRWIYEHEPTENEKNNDIINKRKAENERTTKTYKN